MNYYNNHDFKNITVSKSVDENIKTIRSIMNGSSDLLINEFIISNTKCCLVCLEGMISISVITKLIFNPIMAIRLPDNSTSEEVYSYIKDRMLLAVDRALSINYGDIIRRLMSGFAILFIDDAENAFSYGVQGYSIRGIDEPSTEGNIYGARDGFVETVRINMSLIRRKIKSPLLKFELFAVTSLSNVDVIVTYMSDRVSPKLVNKVKRELKSMKLEAILSSGYIEPYLNNTKPSLFSGVSLTERPDVFCSKILEGRIGVMIDGLPFAVITPALFIENFQTLDDYVFRPYYTTFIRLIRYAAFIAAVFLPAFYVAIITFHPELFNHTLLVTLIQAEELAPLPLMVEALLILFFYEIIREAGVRLPKSVGGAVSIVGGLIIGDAAVSAGIISNPLLLVCAISVTASFVIPPLNQPVTILRFISVIAAGAFGLYGIALITALMLINICSMENDGVPSMAPISPFTPYAMRDVFTRIGFRRLGNGTASIENLNGVNINKEGRN